MVRYTVREPEFGEVLNVDNDEFKDVHPKVREFSKMHANFRYANLVEVSREQELRKAATPTIHPPWSLALRDLIMAEHGTDKMREKHNAIIEEEIDTGYRPRPVVD